MCVIVDANVAALVFREKPDPDFAPVLDWLSSPRTKGCVVYGGHLEEELTKRRDTRVRLLTLSRTGRAILCSRERVDEAERWAKATGLCRSDDSHVIALARVSGARTLCSRDRDLHADFKNKTLVDNPRGAIYQNPSHRRHLRHTRSCGR